MLIPLLPVPASPPTKAPSHHPFSQEAKETKNFTLMLLLGQWGKCDQKLMKDVRCLTCRQRAQILTVHSIVDERERERGKRGRRQNMKREGNGSCLFQQFFKVPSVQVLTKKGRKIQYPKEKKKKENLSKFLYHID